MVPPMQSDREHQEKLIEIKYVINLFAVIPQLTNYS